LNAPSSTPTQTPDPLIEGVQAVRDQALAVLERLGFPRFDDVGQPFDPAHHEAVGVIDSDAPAGTVVAVIRPTTCSPIPRCARGTTRSATTFARCLRAWTPRRGRERGRVPGRGRGARAERGLGERATRLCGSTSAMTSTSRICLGACSEAGDDGGGGRSPGRIKRPNWNSRSRRPIRAYVVGSPCPAPTAAAASRSRFLPGSLTANASGWPAKAARGREVLSLGTCTSSCVSRLTPAIASRGATSPSSFVWRRGRLRWGCQSRSTPLGARPR
jgi:hypothetical protein